MSRRLLNSLTLQIENSQSGELEAEKKVASMREIVVCGIMLEGGKFRNLL